MRIKFSSKKLLWRVIVPSLIVIFGIILDRSIPQINFISPFLNLLVKIYHIKIPDFFLSILILAIIIWLIFISKRIKGQLKDKIMELDEEHDFILSKLANEEDKTLQQEFLWHLYSEKFENKERSDFNIIINELCKHNLAMLHEDYDEIFVEILEDGLYSLGKKRREN